MSRLPDAKNVLKFYFAAHSAIRADLQIMRRYAEQPFARRDVTRSAFLRWWEHHVRMLRIISELSDNHFFPALQNKMDDKGEFIAQLHALRETVFRTAEGMHGVLEQDTDNARFSEYVATYQAAVTKYIEDHEAIFVPLCLQYWTREEMDRMEMTFALTLSLSQMAEVSPWSMGRLSVKDQAEILRTTPMPIRWLYRFWWLPRYQKRYAAFL